jgi:hypothetical protein
MTKNGRWERLLRWAVADRGAPEGLIGDLWEEKTRGESSAVSYRLAITEYAFRTVP